jgi:hypothetical protein
MLICASYSSRPADAAAESSDLQPLFEAVALAACTSSRLLEARCSGNNGNSAELGELELLASQAPKIWARCLGSSAQMHVRSSAAN